MQQKNGSSKTRRVVFVAVVVLALVLAAAYSREGEGGALHALQSQIMGTTNQVTSVGSSAGAALETAGDAVADLTADPDTLTALREQNAELREMLAEYEEYRQEVDRLRGLLDMKQVSGVTGPVAHVIGRSATAWDQSITIDLGSADGVASGMTIMGATGVIGQVSRAAEHSSTVRLLTDPNSGAAVMVQSSRANGIVRGSLNGLLYLEDIAEDQRPAEGDVIVTSGLGGSYERGLIVGAVVSVGDPATGPGDIVINPNATAELLEEVIVVFKAPEMTSSSTSTTDVSQGQAQGGDQPVADDVYQQPQEDEEAFDDEGYVEDYDEG